MDETQHSPANWIIVSQSPLIVTSMCTCGSDECHFTATVYSAVNVQLNPTGMVKV